MMPLNEASYMTHLINFILNAELQTIKFNSDITEDN